MDCIQLSLGGRVQHEGIDEETGEPVKGSIKGPVGNLKEVVGLFQGSVGIGRPGVFAEVLGRGIVTLLYSFSSGYFPVPMNSICSR